MPLKNKYHVLFNSLHTQVKTSKWPCTSPPRPRPLTRYCKLSDLLCLYNFCLHQRDISFQSVVTDKCTITMPEGNQIWQRLLPQSSPTCASLSHLGCRAASLQFIKLISFLLTLTSSPFSYWLSPMTWIKPENTANLAVLAAFSLTSYL